jgi:ClpX C4-type zinc finger
MTKPLYRITLTCRCCGRTSDRVLPLIPKPDLNINCGHCLMDHAKLIQMAIESAEQIQE